MSASHNDSRAALDNTLVQTTTNKEQAWARIQARGKNVCVAPACQDPNPCYTTHRPEDYYGELVPESICRKVHLVESDQVHLMPLLGRQEGRYWDSKEACFDREYADIAPTETWIQWRVLRRRLQDSLTFVQRKYDEEGVTEVPATKRRAEVDLAMIASFYRHYNDEDDREVDALLADADGDGVEDLCHRLITGIKLLGSPTGIKVWWECASVYWKMSRLAGLGN